MAATTFPLDRKVLTIFIASVSTRNLSGLMTPPHSQRVIAPRIDCEDLEVRGHRVAPVGPIPSLDRRSGWRCGLDGRTLVPQFITRHRRLPMLLILDGGKRRTSRLRWGGPIRWRSIRSKGVARLPPARFYAFQGALQAAEIAPERKQRMQDVRIRCVPVVANWPLTSERRAPKNVRGSGLCTASVRS